MTVTNRSILLTVTFVLSLALCACEEDEICSAEQEFCLAVDKLDFESTGPIINDYLAGLAKGKPDEHLNNLVGWLEFKGCIDNAEILCNSCIKTLPAQSELSIDFSSNGQNITKTLDVVMGEPLEYGGYHD